MSDILHSSSVGPDSWGALARLLAGWGCLMCCSWGCQFGEKQWRDEEPHPLLADGTAWGCSQDGVKGAERGPTAQLLEGLKTISAGIGALLPIWS